MKVWKCPECATLKQSKDDTIIYICPACLSSMKIIEDSRKKESGKQWKIKK